MYLLEGNQEWNQIHHDDLWICNKLFLSRVLGYTCGPIGTTVPKPDFYIVRPSINFLGMGIHARIEWIESTTDHFHPAEFWCEIFQGEHLSVDFKNEICELVVKGTRKSNDPLYKWEKWEKIGQKVDFPSILSTLKGQYEWINCEFIDNYLIEVQFRPNSDFRYNNTVAIPVWDENCPQELSDYQFVKDFDYKRKGFWIK